MAKIRVILADDHPLIRTGICALLEKAPDISVIAQAETGAEVLRMVEEMSPDILLLDMEMPDATGVEIARQLKARNSLVHVLALSAHDDAQYVQNLLASGAAGYLTKEEAPEIIVDAIRGIARGEKGWVSRRAVAKMAVWPSQNNQTAQDITPREREVLQLVATGKTNQEIAAALSISEKTVEKHVGAILSKLNVTSRVEAAVWAVQNGMV